MQEARAIMVGTSEPASPASPETGKSGREDDAIADLQPIAAEETAKEKAERLAKERSENLKEWGGKASLGTLFSLATCTEKLVLLIGIIGALGHGAGKPLLCLMFGNLIDGMGSTQFTIPIANLTMEEYQALANDSMMSQVGEIAVKFILIGAGVLVAATMQGFGFSWFAAHQVTKMRPLYFDAMLHRDVGWFDTHSPGALPGEMASDLDQFAEGFGNKLGVAVMSLSGLITGLTVGFTLSWQISLLMLVTLPLMALGAVLMASAVKDAMQQVQGPYEKAAALADEMLFAIRTVVAFGGEARELKRYGAATDLAKRGGRLRLSI